MTKHTKNTNRRTVTDLDTLVKEVRDVAGPDEYTIVVTTKNTAGGEKSMDVQTTIKRDRFR